MHTGLMIGGTMSLILAAVSLSSAGSDVAKKGTTLRAVVHINFEDPKRQEHGLKNMENILKEEKDAVLEVIVHGKGIGLLVKDQSKHAAKIAELMKRGVLFHACENTMRNESLKKEDLLPGVATVPSGAVAILRKQEAGYGYFRP